MTTVAKGKSKVENTNVFESLQALYFSGKVKPSLNKIIAELKNNPQDLDLTLLACKCLTRSKDYETLDTYADLAIGLDTENSEAHYYKGIALQNIKGKEQDALKSFNKALKADPENTIYLLGKANTHLALFTDYHLPVKLAEKHRDKGEDSLLKIISLIEEKGEEGTFLEYLTIGNVSTTVKRNLDAKKYFIKAVDRFNSADESEQDKNIYKEIIKSQKACVKLMDKFTE